MDEKALLRELARMELARRGVLDVAQDKYALFQQRYFEDPVGFVRDCIEHGNGRGAYDYQNKIMDALVKSRTGRLSVRGPHGLGKTTVAAWLVLWFALTRDGKYSWKCPTTASTWRQVEKFLWPEIRRWAQRLKWNTIGREPFNENEMMQMSLRLRTGEAFGMASNNPFLIEGAHAQWMFYIFDEAKAIPPEMWDAAEGAFSTGNGFWLAVSTPGDTAGRFYEIHARRPGLEDWDVIHVTADEMIAEGVMNKKWYESRKRQWGEDSEQFQNRVLGNFAKQSRGGIAIEKIEAAVARWEIMKESGGLDKWVSLGVDVGIELDASVIAKCGKNAVVEIEERGGRSLELADEIIALMRGNREAIVVVDAIGVGVGLVERLLESDVGDRVIVFRGSERSYSGVDSGIGIEFANKRAEALWLVKKMIENGELAIPNHHGLITDLSVLEWRLDQNGKLLARSKDEIRRVIGRSTDYLDAVAMAYYGLVAGGVQLVIGRDTIMDWRG